MITNQLKKILLKNNIEINYKINSLEFKAKREIITNIYKSKGYDYLNEQLIVFLSYFLDKCFFVKGSYIDFTLSKVLLNNHKGKYSYIESCFDLKNLIPFGEVYDGYYTLVINEDNRVYAEGFELILYGGDPFEAFGNLLQGISIERLEL
ncbi:hypothetical protein [Capnocytophaga sputigena]|uniref:hypothetical protein n=1 Tax=Capnocytophaga sputigena TaxID=1019 RepID=UPI0028D599E3|nr:hypothetical protein [Capnocytophaga sputigena]